MHRLCLPQDVQLLLKLNEGLDLTDTHLQLLNDLIIPGVGELFAYHCRRPDFDKASRTEILSPPRPRETLFLRSPPVAASPAISVWETSDTPRVYGNDQLLVKGTDYFLDEEMGAIVRASGSWRSGPEVIKVTYTGGYLTAPAAGVPDDLKMAAAIQSMIIFLKREEFGVTSRNLEGGSMSFNILTLPLQITMVLDRYVIMRA